MQGKLKLQVLAAYIFDVVLIDTSWCVETSVSPAGIVPALKQPWQSAKDSCWRGPRCSKPHRLECTTREQRGGGLVSACKTNCLCMLIMQLFYCVCSHCCCCMCRIHIHMLLLLLFFIIRVLVCPFVAVCFRWPQSLILLTDKPVSCNTTLCYVELKKTLVVVVGELMCYTTLRVTVFCQWVIM